VSISTIIIAMESISYKEENSFTPETQDRINGFLSRWLTDVQTHLPEVPDDLVVEFDNSILFADANAGGQTWKDKLKLAVREDYARANKDLDELKALFFHECCHVVQEYYLDTESHVTNWESIVNEGLAVVFERTRSGFEAPWYEYDDIDPVGLIEEINRLGNDINWDYWEGYHPEKDEPVLKYRVGAYIVDQALLKNPKLHIEDLIRQGWEKTLQLSKV